VVELLIPCIVVFSFYFLFTLLVALKRNLTEEQVAAILYDTLDGLDYLHREAFLIHRDIKAGNVFITENGQVKLGILERVNVLGDFGVSAQLKSSSGRSRTFIGTPYWVFIIYVLILE
jgi:serine/threonine protein kinase